jgi:hypothetical protein
MIDIFEERDKLKIEISQKQNTLRLIEKIIASKWDDKMSNIIERGEALLEIQAIMRKYPRITREEWDLIFIAT